MHAHFTTDPITPICKYKTQSQYIGLRLHKLLVFKMYNILHMVDTDICLEVMMNKCLLSVMNTGLKRIVFLNFIFHVIDRVNSKFNYACKQQKS